MQPFYINVIADANNILTTEIESDGKKKRRKIPYKPTLFLPSKQQTTFHTLSGESVEPIQFDSIWDAKKFAKQYNEVSGFSFYGNTKYQYTWIAENYPQEEIHFDSSKIDIGTLDIEVACENGFPKPKEASEEVIAITLKNYHTGKTYVYGCRPYTPKSPKVEYIQCTDERELLMKFIVKWEQLDFDIITGWYVRTFDIPYLINRMCRLFDEKTAARMSPWGSISEQTINAFNQDHQIYTLSGLAILDYIILYRKNVLEPRENYKLGYIGEIELGEGKGKLEYDIPFREFYTEHWEKFIDYNIQDVEIVEQLEAKLKLIELQLTVAYFAKINYEDVMFQVRAWDNIIYNWLYRRNIVVPQKETIDKDTQFEGAYVREPIPGMYHWIINYDVKSLYPNIIRALNIGIETKASSHALKVRPSDMLQDTEEFHTSLAKAQAAGTTLAANGICYHKNKQSVFSEMIEKLFTDRQSFQKIVKESKKRLETHPEEKGTLDNTIAKYDLQQKAVKILMNSLYGAMGNQYFRFFDLQNAEAVTMTGQFIIQYVANRLDAYIADVMKRPNLKTVIYCDTDSAYLTLAPLVEQYCQEKTLDQKITFIDRVSKDKIEKEIEKIFVDIVNAINGVPGYLSMAREIIGDVGIWTKKKRYMINAWDTEGFRHKEPKLKVMGSEIKKATIPKFCREALKAAVLIIITGDKERLWDFIAEKNKAFKSLSLDEIGMPRSVNGLDKFGDDAAVWSSGTPMHCRGALVYNFLLKDRKLDHKYRSISEGEKIKFIHLREPNPTRTNVIAFNGIVPQEFQIQKYIDWETQWSKCFVEPLGLILEAIKWPAKRVLTLDEFFS